MSFDGYFARAVTHELSENLLHGRVNRIYQPFDQEVHFQIRANRKNHRLKISIHPMYYHMNLTDQRPVNPAEPPAFLMVLRKYLTSARIIAFEQYQNDRIIEIKFNAYNEIGDAHQYTLIAELMGRHSNLMLVDDFTGEIIDLLKPVPPYQNSFRPLLPGALYQRPPHNDQQTNLTCLSDLELQQWAKHHEQKLLAGQAHQFIQGLSRQTGQLLKYWMEVKELSAFEAIVRFHQQINHCLPTLIVGERRNDFYAMDLEHIHGLRHMFETLSELIDYFFQESLQRERIQQITGNLSRQLTQIIKRNQNRLVNLQKDRKKAEQADLYKLYGELLSAYSYQVSKGQTVAQLPNYYDNNAMIEVPLQPDKSVIDNSQFYFRQYRRFHDSLKHIDRQEQQATAEIAYLETILTQLEQADLEDVEDIRQELVDEKYLRPSRKRRRSQTAASKPRKYQTTDGTTVLVGRNNRQNDQLSLRLAKKDHYWLHARNIPGSHVIIQSTHPTEETFLQAAQLAAYYSKYRQSANVPIDIVPVRNLRKPNGAKPGLVIYEGQRTVYVTPEETQIQQMAFTK